MTEERPARDVWVLCARGCNYIAPDVWVGGLPEVAHDGRGMVFDRVALCCPLPIAKSREAGWFTTLSPFDDDDLTPMAVERAVELARRVAAWRREGERVLVACSYGINRSAFVAGMALVMTGEGTPDEVIRLLRGRRSLPPMAEERVLDNPSFEAFLRAGTF